MHGLSPDDCPHGITNIAGVNECVICERDQLRAELDRLNKYIATHDEEYLAMKDVLRAEHEACVRMRQELEEARRGR